MKSSLRVLLFLFLCTGMGSLVWGQEADAPAWPKDITTKNFVLTLYRPENSTYIDGQLKSNLAFAIKQEGFEPKFGMLWVTSLLDVDRDSRMATLVSVKVDEVRFSEDLTDDQKKRFQTWINEQVPRWAFEFPLDTLLESMEEVSVPSDEYQNDPPKILFANEPSVLIVVDGEPKFREAEKGYALVENTGAFIARETASGQLYIKGGPFWYTATSIDGPWKETGKVPSKLEKMAKKAEPEDLEGEEDPESPKEPPAIRIAKEPSELVVFEGEPEYSPVQGTSLLYVKNTTSDIFMKVETQTYYILVSGRWFSTTDLKGSWIYVDSLDLPEDFGNIPPEHEKSGVLASVAGTEEARNAVYDAQIPQTAAVDRDTEAKEVTYNGDPEFARIENLKLEYAVNTESAVFRDKGTYYLLDNAIWFVGSSPNGPWKVADQRPEEIDKIPPDNPRYNTKYVYIYETSPTVVYVGYTPGYYGSFVYGPTVIYGTGFYYNPWYGGFYYHHHWTYGFSVRYSPRFGWSVGFSFGSPWGWYGHSYWGIGFHHWGPPLYRPPFVYRNRFVRPVHPIYRGRRGVSYYNRPVRRPVNRPVTRPTTRPANRTGGRPSTRPSTSPRTQPSNRTGTRPSTRPSTQDRSRPSTQDRSRPANRTTTRPSTNRSSSTPRTRPSSGYSRPASRTTARPSSRPVARPSGRSRGGRRGGF